ncbi:MAG: heme-binding protein [Blastopirellula sp.]|nr:MAG: heme-binding protein [Blastopirellula sp.]
MISRRLISVLSLVLLFSVCISVKAQTLEEQLKQSSFDQLASEAKNLGDARRGAIIFYQQYMACTKCHQFGQQQNALGPDLSKMTKDLTDAYLVESVLEPSKTIKKGFETVNILTTAGKTHTGLIADQNESRVILRDAAESFARVSIAADDIEIQSAGKVSLMPAGQVNVLTGKQQFYDLVQYLIALRNGGVQAARELEPAPSLYVARPLPEYEKTIDHAGMISTLDNESLKRGAAIYNRLCINCHGTHDKPGSLPTALRFADGKFKNGHDPYTMYQTLTRGFGMMIPQTWMVPQQKYDVIHYIRETYLKKHNEAQLFDATKDYLATLPKGDSRGPEPSNILLWEQMDYGPNLTSTYEFGNDAKNFAYKGNAIRLDHGPGGVSQGNSWFVFDEDTMRVAGVWTGDQFIDWNGIQFNGRHNIHPRVVGQMLFENPTGPGWANPDTGSFEDTRLRGRDDRIYGPLTRDWAHYQGMYAHGGDTILHYTVGDTTIHEMPQLAGTNSTPVIKRIFNIGERNKPLILQVLKTASPSQLTNLNVDRKNASFIGLGISDQKPVEVKTEQSDLRFDGSNYVEVKDGKSFNMYDKDFTVTGRIKTKTDGTIFCKTENKSKWVADGKSLFIRGGKLTYDIGWVGAVSSSVRVTDNKWHNVALVYQAKEKQVQLYVDGKVVGEGKLAPKNKSNKQVIRIGHTASNFPPKPTFKGDLQTVSFYQRVLNENELKTTPAKQSLIAAWNFENTKSNPIVPIAGKKVQGTIVATGGPSANAADQPGNAITAGVAGDIAGMQWKTDDQGNLRLTIPAGNGPIQFTLYHAPVTDLANTESVLASLDTDNSRQDLSAKMNGGPTRWAGLLKTKVELGDSSGPFAVDTLTHPESNPWFCRMRLTGFDFFPDGDSVAVSSWDGNVWMVRGLSQLDQPRSEGSPAPELTWQRIASGLFQPLGVKVVDDKIHVTCRDQLCILHDLNGDGETDYYESFNNDHQVTEHFHEFAMGLQTDAEGNFYYAKSARHALTALVPHHGTLLRISKDGLKTDIIATGFRAANGVCLNPDGSFIVTDQEGHWNPKNRINWVKPGGFYGNMFGYHDVTDDSDEAMQQPLCWITNQFDRSPAELLWVDSEKWGPLNGTLLNLSYGYGKVYVVPHEEINGQKQGGMCQLPIPKFETGTMRGRFREDDGQLYLCGMFSWAGSQQKPGGFYRLRYTGQPSHLPIGLHATTKGMKIELTDSLDLESAENADNYSVKVWSLKRTASYGSKHYDEHFIDVKSAKLADDGKSVFLEIPEIAPTWGMEIKYSLKSSTGEVVNGTIHNTIHNLAP